jgi:hypothetical protein
MPRIHLQITIAFAMLLFCTVIAIADDSTNSRANRQREIEQEMARLNEINMKREPIGSRTSYSVTTNSDYQLVWHMSNDTSGSNWIASGGRAQIPLPYTYTETNSGISLHVEADGRYVTAINSDGKTLWHRKPFADETIRYIGKATGGIEEKWAKQNKKVVKVVSNSRYFDFGALDINNGDFLGLEGIERSTASKNP